jgi:hypothetical protein
MRIRSRASGGRQVNRRELVDRYARPGPKPSIKAGTRYTDTIEHPDLNESTRPDTTP